VHALVRGPESLLPRPFAPGRALKRDQALTLPAFPLPTVPRRVRGHPRARWPPCEPPSR